VWRLQVWDLQLQGLHELSYHPQPPAHSRHAASLLLLILKFQHLHAAVSSQLPLPMRIRVGETDLSSSNGEGIAQNNGLSQTIG